jgi:hypothetical protein
MAAEMIGTLMAISREKRETDIDVAGDDFGRTGLEQHVVERDGLANAD